MRNKNLSFPALVSASLAMTGCETAADRQAADQSRCSGYGLQPGSVAFAQCMMTTDMRREAKDEAAKNRDAYIQSTSRAHNGDSSYKVCSAAMPDVQLDVSTGKWSGPNCRQE